MFTSKLLEVEPRRRLSHQPSLNFRATSSPTSAQQTQQNDAVFAVPIDAALIESIERNALELAKNLDTATAAFEDKLRL
ncbi:hypothetical protein HDU99_001390, partial [Rhizoclosmatium hyalinum]